MAQGERVIWSAFYRGDTQAVLARTLDGKRGEFPRAAAGAVIGALVFSGRLEEAERTYEHERESLGTRAGIEARFFLAVGFTRHSNEEKTRKYLLENLACRSNDLDPKSRFYLCQGVGFLRFFTADYRRGLKWASWAAEAAARARFTFGKAFAFELLGHCQSQVGEISEGLKSIELAIAQAKLLGDGALVRSFKIAHALYRAQFGREPERSLTELVELADGKLDAFPYSKANVLLELARQFRIRGDLARAKAYLDQASPLAYQLKHRRCAATLKMRYASLLEARGEPEQALQLTRGALAELDSRFDRGLKIEIRGMEARLLASLDLVEEAARARAETDRLAVGTGKYVHRRIESRQSLLAPARVSEDPLGDLIDDVFSRKEEALSDVVRTGYLGLCQHALGIPKSSRAILLRGAGEPPLLFDRGSVSVLADGCTPLMRKFLGLLSRGSVSKGEAIQGIWGYTYSPLRHDSLIYRLAARTRAALGEHAGWIEMTERGYRLAPGVGVQRLGPGKEKLDELGPAGDPTQEWLDRLNHRQLGILRELREASFLDVKTCRRLFGVSEITARRDLVGLLKLGELSRIGKGRAVKYRMVGRRTS